MICIKVKLAKSSSVKQFDNRPIDINDFNLLYIA